MMHATRLPGARRAAGLALIALLMLAACAPRVPVSDFLLQGPGADVPADGVAPVGALQLPPALEAERLATRRQVRDGLFREDVILANATLLPRENRVTIETRDSNAWQRALIGEPTPPRMTADELAAAAAVEFSQSRLDPAVGQGANGYGAYVYRVASGPGEVSCVLARQGVDGSRVGSAGRFYTIEFRYCDPARDAKTLLALFDDITVLGSGLP